MAAGVSTEDRWIPRNLFQTYRTTNLSEELIAFQQSWILRNPGWVLKLYNDTEAAVSLGTCPTKPRTVTSPITSDV
eukprot:2971432-Pyramimonas_sp.AAC.1